MIPGFGVDDGYDGCYLNDVWRWLVDGVWCRLWFPSLRMAVLMDWGIQFQRQRFWRLDESMSGRFYLEPDSHVLLVGSESLVWTVYNRAVIAPLLRSQARFPGNPDQSQRQFIPTPRFRTLSSCYHVPFLTSRLLHN